MLGLRPQLSGVLCATCLLGCASTQSTKRIQNLSTRVADLTRQIHKQRQTIEDLSNRVFILQDRVDANRVAASRRRVSPRPEPRARPSRPARRPAAIASPEETKRSAADRARRKAQRRLPVVKLRAGRRDPRVRHPRPRKRTGRRVRKPKRLVLRLTGTPAPTRGGKPLGPVPTVNHRLAVVPLPAAGGGIAGSAESTGAIGAYRAARALLQKRSYSAAALAFSRFLKLHPRHPYADNANYWLAECFWRRGKIRKAAWVLRKLLKKYPSGNKAPSALLKLGLCEKRLGRKARARKVLSQVVQLYPGTREAALAASHLRRLK